MNHSTTLLKNQISNEEQQMNSINTLSSTSANNQQANNVQFHITNDYDYNQQKREFVRERERERERERCPEKTFFNIKIFLAVISSI